MRNPTRSVSTAAPIAVPPSSTSPDSKRRRFLFTLGLGGAAAAASADVTTAETAAPDGGYRESAHVRDYYRTAKL